MFAGLVGLGALLLFVVQLLLGKLLLPWFGGASAVWTTCLVFYQLCLLAGYAWAHGLAQLAPRRQRDLHLALVAAAATLLLWRAFAWPSPITPGVRLGPPELEHPIPAILGVLGATIGLPFVALAATSPLLQAWLARLRPGESPVRLYALSNAGSLIGLLGFPLALEPLFDLRTQGWLWAGAFAGYALGVGWLGLRVGRSSEAASTAVEKPTDPEPPHGMGEPRLWLALAFFPSLLLAAVTSHLTQEVAPIPLLWMLPLALYLLSFVLTFARPDARQRGLGVALAVAAGLGLAGLFGSLELRSMPRIALWSVVLFVYGLAGHGELARLRPQASRLTGYYLVIAGGGALGGLFAALVAPVVFSGYWELHVALLLGPATLAWATRQRHVLVAVALVVLAVALAWDVARDAKGVVLAERGFYGVLRVVRDEAGQPDEKLRLLNGRISHGMQLTAPARRDVPTTYYGPRSGVGLAIRRHPKRLAGRPLRVGVIGLGVGTLAAWSRPGDSFRFYELDPQVAQLSRGGAPLFSFLRDARGQVTLSLGDGRLALESEPPQAYDVLVVDAFSSDAVPVHLLTREAFLAYLRHLAEAGVLAVHVTNRHLDLRQVVRGVASELGLKSEHVPSVDHGLEWGCDWMLVARDSTLLADEQISAASLPRAPGARELRWTDAWSDLLSVLKR